MQERVAEAWLAGDAGNGYEPLRSLIAQRYGFTKTSGLSPDQIEQAPRLIIDACHVLDGKVHEQMPNALYEWWKPAPTP